MSTEMRLQKYMADCGIASRRACEAIIESGRVNVNGKKITELGSRIDPNYDKVTVDGIPIEPVRKKYYIMLNKPVGYITSSHDQFGRKTVLDLISADIKDRLYPVGRLDYDSEGLLFLTNDGDFAQKLMHPSSVIDKSYQVTVHKEVLPETANILRCGVIIDGVMTAPAKIKIDAATNLETKMTIIIHEGRNRQIRKMCEAVGHEVISLKRIAVGDIALGNLPRGKWRHLNPAEINKLMKVQDKSGGNKKIWQN